MTQTLTFLSDVDDNDFKNRFIHGMDDDLNTAAGLGLLFDKVRDINTLIDSPAQKTDITSQLVSERKDLLDCSKTLGLLEGEPSHFFQKIIKASPELATVRD